MKKFVRIVMLPLRLVLFVITTVLVVIAYAFIRLYELLTDYMEKS